MSDCIFFLPDTIACVYVKELPQTRHNHLRGRLDEFAEGYESWRYLEDTNLGDVIEFGAGGYTQLRNIMERVNVHVNRVVLVDPLTPHYMEVARCPYASGKLIVNGTAYETIISNSTVEGLDLSSVRSDPNQLFDTLIVMNVLVYAFDAFAFLEKIYSMIKPGGLLIFHDRWFDDSVVSSTCKMVDFYRNTIQIKKPVLDHFLSHFSKEPFYSTNRTIGQLYRSQHWCPGRDEEAGYWVAVRKRLVV